MKLLLRKICLPLTEFTLEVDVEIRSQVTAIFGPSGAGKTSLLDLVAGLRCSQSGWIQLNDRVLTDTAGGVKVPVRFREMGYVPQDLAWLLMAAPRVVCWHEPLASWDLKLKGKIIPSLRRVRDEFHLPMLYVTHDPAEVAAMCDEVLVMERGRFVRRGDPDRILTDDW